MRSILTCFALGLLVGFACVSMPKPEARKATSESTHEVWTYCELEASEIGTFGRELRLSSNGKLELISGYFKDSECVVPGPHMVSSVYKYEIGKEDSEGNIAIKIRSATGVFRTRLKIINGYLYLPENFLLPMADNPMDLNAPFRPTFAH